LNLARAAEYGKTLFACGCDVRSSGRGRNAKFETIVIPQGEALSWHDGRLRETAEGHIETDEQWDHMPADLDDLMVMDALLELRRGADGEIIVDSTPTDWKSRNSPSGPPANGERMWEPPAAIPVGTRVRNANGRCQVAPRAIREQLAAGRRALDTSCHNCGNALGNTTALCRTCGKPRSEERNAPSPSSKAASTMPDAKSCGICYESSETVCFLCNMHFYCAVCATAYFKECLAQGKLPTCPDPGCAAQASARLARRLLRPEEFDQYLMVALRESKQVQACGVCDTAVYIDDRFLGAHTKAGIRCPGCRRCICVDCGLEFHPDCTCDVARKKHLDQQRRHADKQFEAYAQALGLKSCPQCGSACEKMDDRSCDHMTCPKCSHEFCWSCMANRVVIYHHGNHYHNPNCKFYAAYNGPSEFVSKCPCCQQRGRACSPPPRQPRPAR